MTAPTPDQIAAHNRYRDAWLDADDTDEMTPDLIAVVRAVSNLMPTDDADAMLEATADELQRYMRRAAENTTEAWADEADYRYDMARDEAMIGGAA